MMELTRLRFSCGSIFSKHFLSVEGCLASEVEVHGPRLTVVMWRRMGDGFLSELAPTDGQRPGAV